MGWDEMEMKWNEIDFGVHEAESPCETRSTSRWCQKGRFRSGMECVGLGIIEVGINLMVQLEDGYDTT